METELDILDTNVMAAVSGPHPVPELGVNAEDYGMFTYAELFALIELGFIINLG